MTNVEKYKTVEERTKAFREYCNGLKCTECPICEHTATRGCGFAWLDLEAEEEEMTAAEVADILEEHNKWRRGEGEYAEAGAKCSITAEELGTAIDRAVKILRNVKE